VADIVARHIGHPVPGDILALIGSAFTASATFVCGYVAKHVAPGTVAEVAHVADFAATAVAQVADEVEAEAQPTASEAPAHNLMTGA
jgi:hypothetical protein